MQNVPKIVSERLRAKTAAIDHPDADVLAAFSEHALVGSERVVVLEHLAGCRDCRAILALSLPVEETTEPVLIPARGSWFTWSALRWGFAVAGILLVASFGILEYRQYGREQSTIATFKEPRVESPETRVAAQGKAQPAEVVSTSQQKQKSKPAVGSAGAKTQSVPIAHGSSVRKQDSVLAANIPPASETVMVEATRATPPNEASQAQAAPVQLSQPQDSALAGNETLAAQEENSSARAEQSDPVIKAKQAMTTPTSAGTNATPRWAISAAGALQRSFDQGNSWQNVDVTANPVSNDLKSLGSLDSQTVAHAKENNNSADKKAPTATPASPVFRVFAVNGSDVWAGGSNAVLYHSLDGGNHWSQIVPASSGTSLTGDVVILEFANAGQGRVRTSTGETWMTMDNGQTWQKR
jgi:hypothetical protein